MHRPEIAGKADPRARGHIHIQIRVSANVKRKIHGLHFGMIIWDNEDLFAVLFYHAVDAKIGGYKIERIFSAENIRATISIAEIRQVNAELILL